MIGVRQRPPPLSIDPGSPTVKAAYYFLVLIERRKESEALREPGTDVIDVWIVNRSEASTEQLRQILGAATDRDPETITFGCDANGKPAVRRAADLYFNVSHSGAYSAIAVTRRGPVGIDIERIRPMDVARIARRAFPNDEVRRLMLLPEARRTAAFFERWVRLEAEVKASGVGLLPGWSSREAPTSNAEWAVCNFSPAPGFVGCVAVSGPNPVTVRLRTQHDQLTRARSA